MTTNRIAPIATSEDRRALSWLINRMWPEADRKGIESALARHECQELDILTVQAVIAAITRPDQRTPALLGLDGDHTNRARAALSQPTRSPQPLTATQRGPACGDCGIEQAFHVYPRVLDGHDWTPDTNPHTSTPEGRAAARHLAGLPERTQP